LALAVLAKYGPIPASASSNGEGLMILAYNVFGSWTVNYAGTLTGDLIGEAFV
jgi:hypothetical protein